MPNEPENDYRVAPVELFFDLIFVFAFIQLSHNLASDLSWVGAAETGVLLITVLTVWYYTSWAATIIPVSCANSTVMVLAVTVMGLLMNTSISGAFDNAAWGFAGPLLLIQLGRTVWTILNAPQSGYKEHYIRVLVWLLATAPLWIAGAVSDSELRLPLWIAAVIIELVGSYLAHPLPGRRLKSQELPFDAEHMLERYNLFLIIALGETVLMSGFSIAEHPTDPLTLLTGILAMIITISLWAVTFGSAQTQAEHHFRHTIDPVGVSRYAMNAVIVMVAGLIVLAVANEQIIHHPTDRSGTYAAAFMVTGGPAVFLVTQSLFLWFVLKIESHKFWIMGLIIAASGAAILVLPPVGVMAIVALILMCFAFHDFFLSSRPELATEQKLDS